MKMKKEVKHSGIGINLMLLITVFFGSLFSSCYTKDDVPVVPPTVSTEPATYTVDITVISDNGPLDGVGIYPMNLTTNASGKTTYTQAGSGNVVFSLMKEGYENVSYTVSLLEAASGEKVTVPAIFFMKAVKVEEPAVYNILGKVFDGITNEPIAGAKVNGTLRGSDVTLAEKMTDANGIFSYAEVAEAGIYDIVITKEGMNDVRYAATLPQVSAGQVYNFNLEVPMYEEGTIEGKTYALSCNIIDTDGTPYNKNVTLMYRINKEETVKMPVSSGSCMISGLKTGTVTIFVKVADPKYNGYAITYDLSSFNIGTIINIPVYLSLAEEGNASEVVLPDEPAKIDVPEVAADPEVETSIAVKTDLNIPAGALKEETLITAIVSGVIENAVIADEATPIADETPANAAFVTGEFLPSGLTFEKPIVWSVVNPFKGSSVVVDKLMLQYSEDGIVWSNVDNEVVYKNGVYSTEIHHFSSYRMVVTSEVDTATASQALTMGTILNEGAKPIAKGEGKFSYKAYEGSEYVISVEDALAAAGISDAKITIMLKKAVEMKQIAGIDSVNMTGTNDIEIIPGWIYIATGKQQFVTKTYTFGIDGKEVKVVVREAKAVVISGRSELYDQHHTHGGHITEGGTGGGAGE